MKVSRECIHCLARQAVEIAEEATSDVTMQEEIIKRSLKELGEIDFNETAPEIAKEIYERINKEKWLEKAENPFDMACRLAIASKMQFSCSCYRV